MQSAPSMECHGVWKPQHLAPSSKHSSSLQGLELGNMSRAKIEIQAPALGKILGGSLQILSQVTGKEHVDLQVVKLEPVLVQIAAHTSRINKQLVEQAFKHTELPASSFPGWTEAIVECWQHLIKKKKHMRSGLGSTRQKMPSLGSGWS